MTMSILNFLMEPVAKSLIEWYITKFKLIELTICMKKLFILAKFYKGSRVQPIPSIALSTYCSSQFDIFSPSKWFDITK